MASPCENCFRQVLGFHPENVSSTESHMRSVSQSKLSLPSGGNCSVSIVIGRDPASNSGALFVPVA